MMAEATMGRPKTRTEGRQHNLWLPDDLYDSIAALATAERRYVVSQIQVMLEQWLEEHKA